MSRTVDERVVEMRFDNRQFESNVRTSMSTLEKLKQSLNFGKSAKGLEGLSSAAKKVDFSGMGNGIDTVHAKFSALQVMGITALTNITNSALNAGKRIVSALTINPVRSGLQEYETQINAVQTILANTQKEGTTVKDVNAALDELNTYADKTIYNFTEMTRNIGTFTAAGVKLDTSVNAIQGIANLAAVSGSTSQQASTAMYQLSQALASGTVKLMDWNSVVNAGMGGQVFQDSLKETARVHGIAIDQMIEDEGSFRETLSKGWLTSEILTETLQKFTLTTEGLTEAQIEQNREMLRSKGYTEEQIDGIFKLGETATDAATKVKTFTQLWDVLKEAAQSGWAQTWRLIIGDFEEARSFFTDISVPLTDMINKMSDARNKLLESALGTTFAGLRNKFLNILEPVKETASSIQEVTSKITDLGGVVDEVILGKFGNGQERFDALTNAGYNWCEVQNKVNETLGNSFRYTEEQIAAQDKLIGTKEKTTTSTEKETSATAKLTDEQKEQIKQMAASYKEKGKDANLTKEQVAALEELNSVTKKLGMPLNDLIDNLDEINGRWLLLNSIKNVGKAIAKVFTSISKAWKETFNVIKPSTIFNIIAVLHKFTASLIINNDTAKKITSTFKGLFSILHIVATLFGGTAKIAITVFSKILGALGTDLLSVTAAFGEAIAKFDKFLFNNKVVNEIFEMIASGVEKAAEAISKFIESLVDNPVIDMIKEMFGGLFEDVDEGETDDVVKGIEKITSAMSVSEQAAKNFKSIIQGVLSGFDLSWSLATTSLMGGLKILNELLKLIGTDLMGVFAKVGDWLTKLNGWVETNTIFGSNTKWEDLAKIIETVGTSIKECWEAFKVLEPVQEMIQRITDAVTKLFDSFGGANFLSIENVTSQIESAFSKVKNWIEGLKDTKHLGVDIVLGIAKGLGEGVGIVVDAITNIATTLMEVFCALLGIESPAKWGIEQGINIVKGIAEGLKAALEIIDDAIRSVGKRIVGAFEKLNISENLSKVFSSIGKVYSNFMEFIKGIDLTKILALIPVTVVLLFAKRIWSLVTTLEAGIKGINAVISGFANIENSFSKVLTAKSRDINAKALQRLAISLAILVGAVVALAYVAKDENANLKGAVATIGALAVILGILAVAVSKIDSASIKYKKGDGLDISGLTTTLIQIGAAMLMLAATVRIMGTMSSDEIKQGFLGLAGAVAAVGAVLLAFGVLANADAAKDIDKAGSMILKVSIAMLLMVGVCKLAAKLNGKEMIKGAEFAAGFAVFVLVLAGCYRLAGGEINKVGGLILTVTIALGLMVGVCKLVGMLSSDEMKKGAEFADRFVSFLLYIKLIAQIFPQAAVQKLGGLLLAVSVSMILMVGVCKLAGTLSPGEAINGAAFVFAFTIFVKHLVKVTTIANTTQIANVAGTIFAISVAIAAMAAVCILLGLLTPDMLIKGLGAVTIFGLLMTTMVAAASGVTDIRGTVMMMALSIGIMAAAVAALSFIKTKKLIGAAEAMAIVMAMFALIESQAKHVWDCAAPLAMMSVVIGVIAVALYKLGGIETDEAISAAKSLSLVMIALASTMMFVDRFGEMSNRAMVSVGVMTLALYGISKMIGILMQLKGTENAIKVAASLSIMLIGLSVAMVILSKMSDAAIDTKGLLKFVLAVSVLTVAMSALAPVLQTMNNVSWGALAKAGVALAGLSIGLNAMNGTLAGSAALLVAAAALRVLAPAIERLGEMSTENIVHSLLALGGAFTVIGVAALLLTSVIVPIIALSAALLLLGVAAVGFGAGVTLLGNGLKTIASVGTEAATSLVESIKIITIGFLEMIPQITAALGQAIIAICQTISEAAPQIGAAVAKLILSVIEGFVAYKAQMIESLFDLVIGVLNGLTEKLPELLDALSNFIVTLMNGLADHMPEFIEAGVQLISSIIQGIVDNIAPIINGILVPILGVITDLIVGIANAIAPYIPIICNSFVIITQTICDAIVRITEILAPFIPNIQGIVEAVSSAITSICNAFMTLISQIAPIINSISNLIKQMGDSISQVLQSVADTIRACGDSISQILQSISDTISSVFTGIADVITSIGESIKSVLDGIANVIESIGTAALDAGTGFENLANGVKTITDLPLADMAASLGAVATGVADIASHSEGLASAGTGMQQIANGTTMSSNAFNTMAIGIATVIQRLSMIGFVAVTSMSMLTTSVSGSSSCFTTLSTTAVATMTSMMSILAATVMSGSAMIAGAFNTMMTSAVAAIRSRAGAFISAGIAMMDGFRAGIMAGSASITPIVMIAVTRAYAVILSRRGQFTAAGLQLMIGLRAGVMTGATGVLAVLTMIVARSMTLIMSRRGQFMAAGVQLMQGLATGLRDGSGGISSSVSRVVASCISGIRSVRTSFYNAGLYLGQGLTQGIAAQESAAYNAGYRLGKKAVQGELDGQKSQSPSKATKQAGKWLGEGLIIGMEQMGKAVYNSGKSMGQSAVDSISGALIGINDISNSNLDVLPTIRPVVDMADLQNGSRTMQIGADLSARLLSKPVDSLQQIVANAQESINASNNEVIQAIKGLREDLNQYYSAEDPEISLYVDSKKLASSIAKPMNRQLNILSKRGAY